MNPGRFFMPNMANMGMRVSPMMGGAMMPNPRGIGLFSRIGNGIKSFNFGGLLTGASKTLNVVNQTIPLIRQAKPMVNNMKSMFRLAKAFGSETVSRKGGRNINNDRNVRVHNNNKQNNNLRNSKNEINVISDTSNNKERDTDNYPNFFI